MESFRYKHPYSKSNAMPLIKAWTVAASITKINARGKPKAMSTAVAGKGLEGIVAANSGI